MRTSSMASRGGDAMPAWSTFRHFRICFLLSCWDSPFTWSMDMGHAGKLLLASGSSPMEGKERVHKSSRMAAGQGDGRWKDEAWDPCRTGRTVYLQGHGNKQHELHASNTLSICLPAAPSSGDPSLETRQE